MNAGAFRMSADQRYTRDRRDRLVDPDARESERNYALVTHLSLLAMHATFIPILGPILWYIRRSDTPFLDDHGREAVNFQISILIYMLISIVLTPVLIGFPMVIGVYVLAIIGCVRGAMASHRGQFFRYPMCIRLLG